MQGFYSPLLGMPLESFGQLREVREYKSPGHVEGGGRGLWRVRGTGGGRNGSQRESLPSSQFSTTPLGGPCPLLEFGSTKEW